MPSFFVDTNIFLRHLLQDHPDQSPRATALLFRIEAGEIDGHISDVVIFELVYTLQRSYRHSKAAIREALVPLIELPGIALAGKRRFRRVFDMYVERNISFADAYHAVLAGQLGLNQIVSYDRDFDGVPSLERIEP